MNYKSLMYISSNEMQEEEVRITHPKGILRTLFGVPEKTEVYVGGGLVWYEKDTGLKINNVKKVFEILDIIEQIKTDTQWNPKGVKLGVYWGWPG